MLQLFFIVSMFVFSNSAIAADLKYCPVYKHEGTPTVMHHVMQNGILLTVVTETINLGRVYKMSIVQGQHRFSFDTFVSSVLGEKSNYCEYFPEQGYVIVKTMPILNPFGPEVSSELIQPVFRFDMVKGDLGILFYDFQNRIVFGPMKFSPNFAPAAAPQAAAPAPVEVQVRASVRAHGSSAGAVQGPQVGSVTDQVAAPVAQALSPAVQSPEAQSQKQQVRKMTGHFSIRNMPKWTDYSEVQGNPSKNVWSDYSYPQENQPRKKREIPEDFACSRCGETSTPEARRGPNGQHTLCNRCGLRWLKAGEPDHFDF